MTALSLISQYALWPELLLEGYGSGSRVSLDTRSPDRVLVCGVGGSGSAGDFARLAAGIYGSRAVIDVVKDFAPDSRVLREEGLVVAVSYSGNTIETIACLAEALRTGAPAVAVSSGGLLRELAYKKGIAWVPVRPGLKPRAALPAMLGALLSVLERAGVVSVKPGDLEEASRRLRELEPAGVAAYAEGIAGSRVVVVASTREVLAVAERWRSEIAENAKRVAKVEVYPEAAHNDLNSWRYSDVDALMIAVEGWSEHSLESLRIASSVFRDTGRKVLTVRVERSLGGVLEAALLAGYSTVMAASILGLDPAETTAIEAYRRSLETLWRARLDSIFSDLTP